MAIDTLDKVFKTPSGDKVMHCPRAAASPNSFISINKIIGTITFKIQNGPIKEVGVNGCQVTALIEVAQMMLEGLNESFPCDENEMTIIKLKEALMWQDQRTKERERRGVEGLNRL